MVHAVHPNDLSSLYLLHILCKRVDLVVQAYHYTIRRPLDGIGAEASQVGLTSA